MIKIIIIVSEKEKIKKFLEYKGISKSGFYKKTGLSVGFLDSGNSLGVDKLKIIIIEYPELNINWIVLGEGEMLKPENSIPILIEKSTTSDQRDNEHIELLRNHIESLKDQITTLKDLSGSLKDQVMILKEQISELKREAKHFESAPTASTSEGVAIPAALLTGSTPRSGKSR